jgi:hypothetical protein
VKTLQRRIVLLDPLRAVALELANERRYLDRATETIQDMDMVGDAANDDSRAFVLLTDPGQIGMSAFPEDLVHQQGFAVLRREDDVNVNLG